VLLGRVLLFDFFFLEFGWESVSGLGGWARGWLVVLLRELFFLCWLVFFCLVVCHGGVGKYFREREGGLLTPGVIFRSWARVEASLEDVGVLEVVAFGRDFHGGESHWEGGEENDFWGPTLLLEARIARIGVLIVTLRAFASFSESFPCVSRW